MGDADALLLQRLPEEHVLIAAPFEPLVEGTGLERLALDHEVGRSELVILVCLPLLRAVFRLGVLLVQVAQVVALTVVIGDADAAVDHPLVLVLHIPLEEAVVGDVDVAVHEQQPMVAAAGAEVVAGGGAARVLLLHDIAAVGQFVDGAVYPDGILVGRGIVGHKDLVRDVERRSLLLQHRHQSHAYIIIIGYQYRQFSLRLHACLII